MKLCGNWSTNSTFARPDQTMCEIVETGRGRPASNYTDSTSGSSTWKQVFPGFEVTLNASPVLLHNSLDRVQAEACSFSNSLGGKKRLEDVGLYLGRNSGTVVANLDYDASVVAIGSNSSSPFPRIASIALSMMLVQTWLSSLPNEFTSRGMRCNRAVRLLLVSACDSGS